MPLVLLASLVLANPPVVRPQVEEAARLHATVDVVVLVSSAPDEVLAALPSAEVQPYRVMRALSAFAAHATPRGLDALSKHPAVRAVTLDGRLRALTAESAAVLRADVVRDSLGVTGKGVVVAALDTGVDATHPDLADGGILEQKCFVLGGCQPGNVDEGVLAPEGSGHGTHVTGILTGDGVRAPKGLAPGSRVVMVRVFDDTSYGRESDWAIAMEWLADNAARLGLRVVNLSIGTDERYPGVCDADWPLMATAAAHLADAGVVMFGAAGNENEANALVAPACLTHVIAVGATYDAPLGREPDTGTYSSGCFDAVTDAGTVMCLSNTSDELDLLAPGSVITSAAPGGGGTTRRGTSQATPHASAVAALMLEADPKLTPGDVLRILEDTGRPVVDPKAPGRVTPLIDARAAVEAVQASFCARHGGEACALPASACDGGTCTGRCVQGACVGAGDIVLPALSSTEGGTVVVYCSCTTVDGGFALLGLGLWLARRRRLR
ncbi:MAG: S8 family serine peptidase [Myxococcota bacterium]